MHEPDPIRPDFDGRSTLGVIPALTWGLESAVLPDTVVGAQQAVVLVLDSLGWEQLCARSEVAPTLAAMQGAAATTVAPSTTAAALTSISTGVPPGEHGIIGYRFPAGGAVMNALRWTTPGGDHREVAAPTSVQVAPPLGGGPWAIVSNRQFADSAFTEAYLGRNPYHGWDHPSTIIAECRRLLDEGERRVYAYYDGLDHVAHIHGVDSMAFDAELAFCDWLVASLCAALPSGAAVVVTADHGQVDAAPIVAVDRNVLRLCAGRSGEPRFRWLHAKPGRSDEMLAAATEAHGEQAWVWTRDRLIDEGWFGPQVSDAARSRMGDVALIAHAPVGFDDPGERHAGLLKGRHGSLTEAEMLVPVLHTVI